MSNQVNISKADNGYIVEYNEDPEPSSNEGFLKVNPYIKKVFLTKDDAIDEARKALQ